MSIVHLPATDIITDREQKFHDLRKLFLGLSATATCHASAEGAA